MKDIEEKKETRSLMPDGLTQPLTDQEFLDLSRFLSELGKLGPYAPNPAPIFRRWDVIEGTGANTERMRRTRATIAAEAENGLTWTPTVSMVNGELPMSEIPKWQVWNNTSFQSALQTKLDITQPGEVKFQLNSPDGVTMFVDGKPFDSKTAIPLSKGTSTIVLLIDRSQRTANVSLQILDVPGSKAIAKPAMK
jgi:hypothetical protein